MSGYLYIQLDHLHIRTNRQIFEEYISFSWADNFYFSRTYSHTDIQNFSIPLNHAILLPVDQQQPFQSIMLQLWENHMIVLEHEIDIAQLNTRGTTRKKLQVRQGEILQFSVRQLSGNQIVGSKSLNTSLMQHFIVMDNLTATDKGQDFGPSYFKVNFDDGSIIVPVINSVIMLPLPNKFTFWHIKNGKELSHSKLLDCTDFDTCEVKVSMIVKEDNGYDLEANIRWVSNISRNQSDQSALIGAHDILLSEIQIRFQAKEGMKVDMRAEHVNGVKFKVTAGNKAFELNGGLDPLKVTRFGRIIYFIVKSEEEDFSFSLEKGPRIVAKAVVGTDQLLSYHPNIIKRKLLDPFSGRVVATLRCRGQKAKNLSLPQNNRFWKKCSQQKMKGMMLQISQVSLLGMGEIHSIVVKSEDTQTIIQDVPDFNIFKLQTVLPQPVDIIMKQEGNIYFKLVGKERGGEQFLGIATINPKQLRMGAVPITLPFYKQKQLISQARFMINKVMPWPFVKGTFQPESLIGSGVKTMSLSLMLKSIELTSYYWSYVYDGKGDIFCIVELNRVKKVLILERVESTKTLLFISSNGSDLLNFSVDHQESFKVKITVLATDQGVQEEIYGTSQKRVKVDNLTEGPMLFKNQPIANNCNVQVGELEFQIQKGLVGEFKRGPVKKELNLVKMDLKKINKSIEIVQKKMNSPQNRRGNYKSRKRFQSLVLPEIKDPKQERLKRLAKMIQAKQQKKRYPRANASSLAQSTDDVILKRRSRVQSQGLHAVEPRYKEVDEPLPPFPLTVREEQDRGQRNSELRIDLPPNQFQQNEFANNDLNDIHYEEPFEADPFRQE